MSEQHHSRLPPWMKVRLGTGDQYQLVRAIVSGNRLHTVCNSARCPNMGECWSSGTATFMILGDICTRDCRFCAVTHGTPGPLDMAEADRILDAVRQLKLEYVVITSVTRDDLSDGGASLFVRVISLLKLNLPRLKIEVLTPDFEGDEASIRAVADAGPDVFNHNLETVPRLYDSVRPQADYRRSLETLRIASHILSEERTKSGLMIGMGETRKELLSALKDLRRYGVGRLTLGQYLQPSKDHYPIDRFVTPDEFKELEALALNMGFLYAACAPLVRSSYHAGEMQMPADQR